MHIAPGEKKENLGYQHITTVLWPFFRDHPDEPVPEENYQDSDLYKSHLGKTLVSRLGVAVGIGGGIFV